MPLRPAVLATAKHNGTNSGRGSGRLVGAPGLEPPAAVSLSKQTRAVTSNNQHNRSRHHLARTAGENGAVISIRGVLVREAISMAVNAGS